MTEADRSIISSVREGMSVVDSEGSEIGTIELVKIADPEATTAQGQQEPTETPGPPVGPGSPPPFGTSGVPGGVPGGAASGMPGVTGVPATPAAFPTGDNEPDLPAPLAERLLREGYVKIDSKGLFRRDLYVGANQIGQVDGDVVHLSVPRSDLAKES